MQPPPAPPPPPPLQPPPPLLSSSRWSSSNSKREKSNPVFAPTTAAPSRLDAQTLQHAVAGLRKTQHNQQIRGEFEDLSDGRMDRKDVQMYRRYGQDSPYNASFQPNQTRGTFHASAVDSSKSVPVSDVYRYTDSLNYKSLERPVQQPYSTNSEYPTHSQITHKNPYETPYIKDPKSYIRAYATQTPASSIMDQSNKYTLYQERTTEVPPSQPNNTTKFVKELRDQGLTRTQKVANQFQKSQIPERTAPQHLDNLFKEKQRLGSDQIDSLIRDMEWKMKTGVGAAGDNNCCKCGEGITNDRPGCVAVEQVFHVACFKCNACGKQLAGASFYNVDGKPLCEEDYKNTLEKCTSCGMPIMEKLLRASGSAYHPGCFVCSVCIKCLDGVPFTVDSNNQIYCVPCFHQRFAPRCAVCSQPIVPGEGEKESIRIVAMDKSFHVNCYKCEDCHIQLSSKIDGQGCYPLDRHLYCKNCSGKRVIALSGAV